jgi:hypothetical protein
MQNRELDPIGELYPHKCQIWSQVIVHHDSLSTEVPQLRQGQILWFDTTARLALNEVGFAMLDKNSTAVDPIHAAKVIERHAAPW